MTFHFSRLTLSMNMEPTKLKELWLEHGFRPDKSYGQNFLMDKNVRDKLLDAYALDPDDTVVEIGPGFGVMTFETAGRCGHVYAVEKDRRICSIMAPFFADVGNITLVNADILGFDIRAIAKAPRRVKVVGNIPYCISTPIVEMLVDQKECVDSACLVMQDELADRIASPPGSRDFSSISCYVQYYTSVKKIFKISRHCFFPKPAVDSCLLRMEFLKEPSVKVGDERLFFEIIHKAFSERRKQVVNPLSSGAFLGMDKKAWMGLLTGCGIDPAKRAESLSLEDYARLTDAAKAAISKTKA